MNEPIILEYKQLNRVANLIKRGKAAVVETDTLVGIVAKRPDIIYSIKRRPVDKPLVTLVAKPVLTKNEVAKKLMAKHWPGALTLVIGGVSYRQPDHKMLLRLLEMTGPLYSSSCNVSGKPPIRSCTHGTEMFPNDYDRLIFVRGKERDPVPSTVFDCDESRIIRQGRVVPEL